jgi:DNA (cytosine-5)-methyltransferase 1
MMEVSRLSRYGMTFKPLMESLGEELLTLYLADFHAKTLAPQEKAQELMENDQECGEKWRGSFVKYDQNTSLWRTHQCSLLGGLDEFLETWPQWGLMRNGECWEQRTLEQTIRGTEFGLLPNGVDSFHTPNTTGLDGGSNSRKALKKRQETWPTPTAHNSKETNAPTEYTRDTPTLTATIMMRKWGTPKVQDSRHALRDRNKGNLGEQVSGLHNGGKLNPLWTEWLMGWWIGWTDLKPLEMDKFHCAPQQHGES